MELEKLYKYKIEESNVLSDIDRKHIENYKQLIIFFENAINQSIKDGKTDFNSLHSSVLQSIRYLDNLTYTYEGNVAGVRLLNKTIDKIISDNRPLGKNKVEKKEVIREEENQKN